MNSAPSTQHPALPPRVTPDHTHVGSKVRTIRYTATRADERKNTFDIYQGTPGMLMAIHDSWAAVKFDRWQNVVEVERDALEVIQ